MKTKIRNFAKKHLKSYSQKPNIWLHDKRVSQFLLHWICAQKPKCVLLYLPMPHEINLKSLAFELKRKKITVLVPKVNGEVMEAVSLRLPLRLGAYKISESSSFTPYQGKIDLAIVPILGFDSAMRRIGFGCGYYDRFLEGNVGKPYIIFAARFLIFSRQNVTHDHDVRADLIVSSRAFLNIKGKRQNGNYRSRSYYLNSDCSHWVISRF
ncbi:5-formyltetrahydrofolate cyclo-ligase [Helicobacter pametensis]|uniref:5-formyltetrahydrofolate cyclo-ligase n=1 Tax=Helicobacter pametensis TaxID=95149 RepID=UPI0004AF3580|nr:5-formyltetrahydrofolate cyclo-ligase [Helicobacter pametensis]